MPTPSTPPSPHAVRRGATLCCALAATLALHLSTTITTAAYQPAPPPPPPAPPSTANLPVVGQLAPPITLPALLQAPAGATATNNSLRGKAVVIEFWATWCAPCIAAIPHLNALADTFKDEPIVFLAVTDEPESKVAPWLRRREIRAWVGLDAGGAMQTAYGVTSIPRTILIDKHGNIAAVTRPTNITEDTIRDLLAGRPIAAIPEPKLVPFKAAAPAAAEPEAAAPANWPLFHLTITRSPAGAPRGMHASPAGMTIKAHRPIEIFSRAHGTPQRQVLLEAPLPEEPHDFTIEWAGQPQQALWAALADAMDRTFAVRCAKEPRDTDVLVLRAPTGIGQGLRKIEEPDGSSAVVSPTQIQGIATPIPGLTAQLSRLLNSIIIDKTTLDGAYDFDLICDTTDPAAIKAALADQLGLTLEPARRDVNFLIIRPAP